METQLTAENMSGIFLLYRCHYGFLWVKVVAQASQELQDTPVLPSTCCITSLQPSTLGLDNLKMSRHHVGVDETTASTLLTT